MNDQITNNYIELTNRINLPINLSTYLSIATYLGIKIILLIIPGIYLKLKLKEILLSK